LACSSQYGLPATEVSSQNRNVFVPGSPIGQQQDGAERLACIGADGMTARGATGAMTGMVATGGRGPMTGGARSTWTFDGGGGGGAG
jgi:hypothetical protein